MSRDEFMRELAYLLQDIPEEERLEALQYYEDYFDDAGPEMDASVVAELGSPERVAAIIRTDLTGAMEDAGEFTESGYTDTRFEGPRREVVPRYTRREQQSQQEEPRYWTNNTLKGILFIILIISAAKWIPRILGLGGHIVGFIWGLLGVILAITLLAGLTAAALLFAGGGLVVAGLIKMFAFPLEGILLCGGGVIILGVGLMMVGFAICFYGSFLPFLVRSIGSGSRKLKSGEQGRLKR